MGVTAVERLSSGLDSFPVQKLTKMFARTALSARTLTRTKPASRSMGYVAEFKHSNMSEMPVPKGAWKEAHSKKNTRYNLHLLGGLAFFSGTIFAARETELFDFGWAPKMGNN